ncbi:MAG: helix-turn-helix domain-containing protein [Polyangiaceae bacterium]
MPLFTPVLQEADLPAVERGYEHTTLDAKTSARKGGNAPPAPFSDPELAKDVAAFANALGGTVLVGAREDLPRGVIAAYVPLAETDAKETTEHYNVAASSFCSPRPLIQVARIPLAGGVVLAVNVWPFIGQLVGVSEDGTGRQGRAFRFPYRVGNAAVWIEPEQHVMFMIPAIRRTVILLESIPLDARGELQIMFTDRSQSGPGVVRLDEVDVYKNVAVFTRAAFAPAIGPPIGAMIIRVALDDIERVWLSSSGKWRIRLGTGAQW